MKFSFFVCQVKNKRMNIGETATKKENHQKKKTANLLANGKQLHHWNGKKEKQSIQIGEKRINAHAKATCERKKESNRFFFCAFRFFFALTVFMYFAAFNISHWIDVDSLFHIESLCLFCVCFNSVIRSLDVVKWKSTKCCNANNNFFLPEQTIDFAHLNIPSSNVAAAVVGACGNTLFERFVWNFI